MKKSLFRGLLISAVLLLASCSYIDYCPVCIDNTSDSEVKNVTISWNRDGIPDNLIFESVPAKTKTDWYSAIIDESNLGVKEKSTQFAVSYEKDGVFYDIKNSSTVVKVGGIFIDDQAVLNTDDKITIRISENGYTILKK